MLLWALLGAACFVIGCSTVVGVLMKQRAERKGLMQRVSRVARAPEPSARAGRKRTRKIALVAANERMRGVFAIGIAHRWGMYATIPTLLLGGTVSAVAMWFLLHGAIGLSAWIALAAGVAAFVLLPRTILKRQQNKSEQQFLNLFPDTIDMIIRMLRAGVPVTTAVRTISHDAPPPVNAVFAALANQVDIGIPFDEALNLTGRRIGMPDFRFFSVAVSLQHATGGNLASTLEILSDIIRKRRSLRLKAKATTAEARMSAYVLGAIPFLVIGGLLVTSPDYLAPLVTDPRGHVIAGMAIGSLLLGFMTMRQMMRRATSL